MRRSVMLAAFALLLLLAMPMALGKGVGGLVVQGPGIDGQLTIVGDGTPASAERVNPWISGAGFPELAYGSDTRAITSSPQTDNLGPEYRITWIHMGPRGDFEIPALLYPLAEGGALVYMEPGAYFDDIDMTVTGGWYHSTADLAALLEQYGVHVALETESAQVTTLAEPPPEEPTAPADAAASGQPIAGTSRWLALAGLGIATALVGLWATGRRPRRLRAS